MIGEPGYRKSMQEMFRETLQGVMNEVGFNQSDEKESKGEKTN